MAEGYQDIGCAKLDLDRRRRNGFAEVIYGESKSVSQLICIATHLLEAGENVLATRVSEDKAQAVCGACKGLAYDVDARCLYAIQTPPPFIGRIALVTAGTADWPVAAETKCVAQFLGLEVDVFCDVGVAGIHRLLDQMDAINAHEVLICVAGMEGALVSVLGGLTDKPLLAVPSGVGYGAGAGGMATLMAMLNACASGVSVLNIGNGFGAAYMAATICRQIRHATAEALAAYQKEGV